MNIAYSNIGTEFQKFNLYLEEEDYIELLSHEMAFGKVLNVFARLGGIILDDPEKLRDWVLHDSRYSRVLTVARKIVDTITTGSPDYELSNHSSLSEEERVAIKQAIADATDLLLKEIKKQ